MSNQSALRDRREIELKLLAEPCVLARLRRSPLIGRFAEGSAVSRSLRSIYYDTPDLALHKRRLALRVRTIEGVHVQTLKGEDDNGGAAANRSEFEARLPGGRPDPTLIADSALRGLIARLSVDSGLHPIFEVDVERTEHRLLTPDGDHIELAIDTGVIRAGGREEPVNELEFELKSGRPAALYELARPVAEAFDVRLGVLSKAARGYALATGESGIVPVKAFSPDLDPSMSVEEGCRRVLGACLAQIIRNEPAVVTARDPEGIHQMRVGLRRLRSAAASFSSAGLETWLGPLSKEARRFASRLGRARDLDVFLDEMLSPVEDAFPGHLGLARLRALAEERQEAGWTEARSAIASRRFTVFLLSIAGPLEERPWQKPGAGGHARAAESLNTPVRDLARQVLENHYLQAMKTARDFTGLTAKERHALRIALKKVRYNADFFAPVYSQEDAKPFLKALSDLQDLFGYLNDAVVAARLSRKLVKRAGGKEKGALREAAGLVAGWHARLAADNWRRAGKRWRHFEKILPFWRT